MRDFASAAMLRLIRLGLDRQGLAVPGGAAAGKAHVPLQHKRDLSDALLRAYGPLALLRVGEAIEGAPEEPVMIALARAHGPFDLLARWQRLERFVHSRHRTRVLAQGETALTLRHVALVPHPPPQPGEDLLVFGLLFALLRHCGAEGLRARPCGERLWRLRDGQWHGKGLPGDSACWQVDWTGIRPAAAAEAPARGGDWPVRARQLIEADPGRGWTLAALAGALCLSRRSLQRRLQAQGSRFSEVLATARLNAASRLLLAGDAGLAEIGYLCGFADQAHFSRQFKQHTGATPSQFRSDFAGSS